MTATLQDLRFGLRSLLRRPAFAAVAICTIALAIAANTSMFTVVHGVLLRPPPFPEAERLTTIDVMSPQGYYISTSIPNYRDWGERSRVFAAYGASAGWSLTLTGDGPAEVIRAHMVLGDFFGTLGIQPLMGRLLTAPETEPGAEPVAILSHAFWQQRFGGRPDIVGRTLTLDERPFTVIGVLPPGVGFPTPNVSVYAPMGAEADLPWNDRESSFGTRAIARLAGGVDLTAAQADLDRIAREVRAEEGRDVALPELTPLATYYVGDVTAQLWILMGAVVFVLLIGVANVGNLLLARGEDRRRELAIRAALGAGPRAVTRLLLAEALVLAAIGGVLGAVLAYLGVGALVPLLPAEVPAVLRDQVRVDGTVLGFAVVLSLAAGALFGVFPALRAARVDVHDAMRSGARATERGSNRLRSAFVVGEVAIALVLLVGAALMLRSLDRLHHADKGFATEGVFTAAVPATGDRYSDKGRWQAFYRELRTRAAAIPGVRAVTTALLLPLSDRSWELRVHPEGVPVTRENAQSVLFNVVSPDYFETMSVPMLQGRAFADSDRDESSLVAIIDETMATRFWPGEDPIGKRITIETTPDEEGGQPIYREVVGVAKNVRHYEIESPSRIQVYVPIDQPYRRWGMGMRVAIATSIPPEQVAGPFRNLVAQLDPDAPVYDVQLLAQYVDDALAESRAMTRVLAAFGAAALGLAALGIFGVMSYAVTRQRKEIGIRMALGASAPDVLRWIANRAFRLAGTGVVLGLLAAAALTRVLSGLLYEVSPLDPTIYGVAAAGLLGVAMLAAYLPGRRATRVDPVTVLAAEG